MNGVSNGHRCSIASSEDAASYQGWLSYAMLGPHGRASGKAPANGTLASLGSKGWCNQTGPVQRCGSMARTFLEISGGRASISLAHV